MSLPHSGDAPITCAHWDEVVDSLEWQCYHYIVYFEAGEYHAKKGDSMVITFSDADADVVIQAALGDLTAGRTWKESVCLRGSIELSASVEVPSYTSIYINGQVKAPPTDNAFIDDDAVDTEFVEIHGGKIYGDDGTAATGQRGIYMKRVSDFSCSNMVFHDLDDGINISYGARAKLTMLEIHNCYNGIILNEEGSHDNILTDVEMIGVHIHDTTNDAIIANAGSNGFSTDSVRVINIGGYGLWMRDIYSGAWINNFVADVCGVDGIYVGPGCESIEMSNIWCRSCGEQGIYIRGTGPEVWEFGNVYGVLIQGAVLQNNQETGLKVVDAHQVQCENLKAMDNALRYEADPADDNATNIFIHDDAQVSIKGGRAGWFHTDPANRLNAVRVGMGAGASDDTYAFFEGMILGDRWVMANAHIQYSNNQLVHEINVHTKDMCIGDTNIGTTVCVVAAPSPGVTNIWERGMTKDAYFNEA